MAQGAQHGYGIKQHIERRTGGALSLGSGTLYQAIQRLERSGFIGEADVADPEADARRGRHYELLGVGRDALQAELRRLQQVIEYARSHDLLSDLSTR